VKIEIVVADDVVEQAIEAIIRLRALARSRRQDFVTSVEQVVRIRTGETNESAI